MIGFDKVAELWRRLGVGTPPQAYPSIALGVFEATPLEVATAYTIFTNRGQVQPLHAVRSLLVDGNDDRAAAARRMAPRWPSPRRRILVTSMMRSVLDEGTGASARSSGFRLEAAGKSGTTNDLRDAWFVGFTPELLTVVWVGIDDNTPLGMTGSQAALPIWTSFMTRALAGRGSHVVRDPRWAGLRRHRPRQRRPRHAQLSQDPPRGVPARQRPDRGLSAPRRYTDSRCLFQREGPVSVRPLISVLALALVAACNKQPAAAASQQTGASPAPATAAQPAPAGQPATGGQARPEPRPLRRDPGAAQAPKPVPAVLPQVCAKVDGQPVGRAELEAAIKNAEARAGRPRAGRGA